MKGRRQDVWSYNKYRKKKSQILLGNWHFIGFLQDAGYLWKILKALAFGPVWSKSRFCFFFFPQEKIPTRKTVIFRELIYNQLTATKQRIPWLNLLISMFFTVLVSAFPAIFASALAKRYTQTPGYKLILLPKDRIY